MKSIITILTITLFFSSQDDVYEALLTDKVWEVEKVMNNNTGEFASDKLSEGVTWTFKSDGSLILETHNDFFDNKVEGNWSLHQDTLFVKSENDHNKFGIEQLTDTTLILNSFMENSRNFYLTSDN